MFELIQKDTISPEERAKTLEYHLEEGKRTAFSEGVSEGVKKGLEEGVKKGYIETLKAASNGHGYNDGLPSHRVDRSRGAGIAVKALELGNVKYQSNCGSCASFSLLLLATCKGKIRVIQQPVIAREIPAEVNYYEY